MHGVDVDPNHSYMIHLLMVLRIARFQNLNRIHWHEGAVQDTTVRLFIWRDKVR